MNIVQITPGAGGMYCGGCFHDNALVTALRRLGHDALMVPLYLPLTLDEPDQSAQTPIFFSGVNVFLDHQFPAFRKAPRWLRNLLTSRLLLKWAAGRAAKTRADQVGDLTLSMLRGEEGGQARDLDELVGWLKAHQRPDAICLSNALLSGLARRLTRELQVPVFCLLQGEEGFLDSLPDRHRESAWNILRDRAADIRQFLAPSRYYATQMMRRLGLPETRATVVPDGINLEGYDTLPPNTSAGPVIGYFARMCADKGLHTLVDAFILLKQKPGLESVRLHVGGGCGPTDAPFVAEQCGKLTRAGLADSLAVFPNLDRAGKLKFLSGLSLFSVPALYGEAFGLYLLEALAAGVPVVQPRHAAFPEIIADTGGGVLCEPGHPQALADALAELIRDPSRRQALGEAGRKSVQHRYKAEDMARNFVAALQQAGG